MKRNIIHVNIAGFYSSVAQVLNPKLGSYPLVVATVGHRQRIVLDMSSPAREAGVRKGMSTDAAKRKCPDLIILSPTPAVYRRVGNAVINEASRLSPLVEYAGPGHVFVDLTGTQRLLGQTIDVADRLRKDIKNRFGLQNSMGVASNKLVSKIATRVINPAGLCSVNSGCEETFLAPLPIRLLPGIDSKVMRQLYQFNLRNIRDIHNFPQPVLPMQ